MLTMMLMFFGCSGLSANTKDSGDDPLRGPLSESFHVSLQDRNVRNYLADVDSSTFPPDRKLEICLLGKLGGVKDENGLKIAFDSLWAENEQIRFLVSQPENRTGFSYPLVEIYYLLSAIPEQNWQRETGERLFQETLKDLKPQQISGYALHFYTLALLKNGKYEIAQPFLLRLEKFSSQSIYLEDLTIALDYIMRGKDYKTASQIITLICQIGMDDGVIFPEKEMYKAVTAMKDAGKLELIRDTLTPMIGEHPSLQAYSFVELLQEDTPLRPFKTNEKQKKMMVEVQVIKAGKHSNYIGPELVGIGEDLKEMLNFSSFRLLSQKIFILKTEEKGEILLPDNSYLHIVPLNLIQKKLRIEVSIIKGDQEIFHTVVESVDGGITTIGGPQSDDDMILLRLTTNKTI